MWSVILCLTNRRREICLVFGSFKKLPAVLRECDVYYLH